MNDFTIESFARTCERAMAEAPDAQEAARAVLQQALDENDPAHIMATLDAAIPPGASIGEMIVHTSPTLTMLYARVPPRFQSGIHNHTIFACIGQLSGEEISKVYEPDAEHGLRLVEEVSTRAGQVVTLPADVIHCIENPNDETGAALHIYGGDFGAIADQRSLWSSDDHQQTPFSFERLMLESVKGMKKSNNDAGLAAVKRAIPALEKLVDSL